MTKYIQKLTDRLIREYNFGDTSIEEILNTPADVNHTLLKRIKERLEFGVVATMTGSQCGTILGKIEQGELQLKTITPGGNIHLTFDATILSTLRELVALCLAQLIIDRLNPSLDACHVPFWNGTRPTSP